jgi:hypothetical protein
MKTYRESRAVGAVILNLGIRWGWVVTFILWPPGHFTSGERTLGTYWTGGWNKTSPARNWNPDPPAQSSIILTTSRILGEKRESYTSENPVILCNNNSVPILTWKQKQDLKEVATRQKMQPQLLPFGTCDIEWVMDTLFVPDRCSALLPCMPSLFQYIWEL